MAKAAKKPQSLMKKMEKSETTDPCVCIVNLTNYLRDIYRWQGYLIEELAKCGEALEASRAKKRKGR